MSDWLNVLFNNIKVFDHGQMIEVTGIRTSPFFAEVRRVYGTTRFANGMALNVTGTSFTISKFFLYDFYNIVKGMRDYGTRYFRQEVIDKLVEKIEELPLIEDTTRSFPSKLDYRELERIPVTPLPSQKTFFNIYDEKTQQYHLNGYILAAPPGTGKTWGSLMLMLMRKKKVTFVFSPNNALDEVWKQTIEKIEGAKVWVYGMPPATDGYTHYVFSHENTKYAKSLIGEIIKNVDSDDIGVIVDECHRFTEINTEMVFNLIEICRACGSKDIVFMSGTPFKAMGRELVPFIMATDPTFTPQDEVGFKKIFGVSGNAAREILAARIGRTLFRIDKSEVVQNDVTEYTVKVKVPGGEEFTLPAIRKKMQDFITERYKFYKEHGPAMCDQYLAIVNKFGASLKNPGDQFKFTEYRRLADLIRNTRNLREVPDEIKETNLYEKKVILPTLSASDKAVFKDVKSVYKYLALKIQGEALGRVLGAERMRCNLSIIHHIDNGRIFSEKAGLDGENWTLADVFSNSRSKTVMFSDFIEILRAMEVKLKKDGFTPELVYGDTNKDLSEIIDRFARNPKINPVIATYKSLSTAVPLIMADSAVFLNTPFRDYILQQSVARVDRLGQNHPVHLYTYQLDTGDQVNISTRSRQIMEWSKKMVDELLGITTPTEDLEPLELEYLHSFAKMFPPKVASILKGWMR